MSRVDRPLGVAVIAVLMVIAAILMLLAGLALIGVGVIGILPLELITDIPGMGFLAGVLLTGLGFIVIIFGLVGIFAGWGLWVGRMWAWWLTIILAVIGVLISLPGLLSGGWGAIVPIAIYLIIIYYLTRPHVKTFFGRGRGGPPPPPPPSSPPQETAPQVPLPP